MSNLKRGHTTSMSPTYQSNSHSPLFGAPTSPSFFGGSSNNHVGGGQQQYSTSNNYGYGGGGGGGMGGGDSFPITTFSIEDTLQNQQQSTWNGGSGAGRRNESSNTSSSSIFNNCDDSSSTWNGNSNNSHYGNSMSNNYNGSSGGGGGGGGGGGSHGGNSTGGMSNGLHWNHRDSPRERSDHRDSNSSGSQGHTNSREQQHGSGDNSVNQGVRETGIIEKLLHSYGFIQCCERQARLFFHFSQFEGTIEHLKLGDPVEFEMTYDRRTGKPIASFVTKIGPEVVLSEERVTGTVTTELHHESSGELQGRISYENRGECFFLPYCQEDIEGNVTLCTGDTVSFQIATNHRSGNLTARYVRLENPAQPVRYKGIVSSIKDSFGFIERADVAKEIFFHFSETRVHEGIVVGDNVEFNIQTRNGKEVASSITKLPYGTVIFEDIGMEILKGQMLKPIDKTQPNPATIGPTPRSETMQGRLRYRGPDRQELEVVYGEKDQKGCFTMRHGDWVEFQLAVDRRDKQQRATNITLLEESFVVSGERREEGVISAVKDGCGYITCAERDAKMYFRTNELLDYNRAPKIADDVEFIIVPDPQSPIRQSAIRIKYLSPGTVQFEIPLSNNVSGIVVREPSTPWVSQEALAGILPSLANLGLPPTVTERLIQGLSSAEVIRQLNGTTVQDQQGEPGVISYQLNWQQETIIFHWKDCKDLRNIRVGTKVTFDVHQVRRNREIIAANIRALEDIENLGGQNNSEPNPQSILGEVVNALQNQTQLQPQLLQLQQQQQQQQQQQLQQHIGPILNHQQQLQQQPSPPQQNHCHSVPTSPEPDILPIGSSSEGSSSPLEELDDQLSPTRSSPDMDRMMNGTHSRYEKYGRNRSGSESSANGSSGGGGGGGGRPQRFVMKGHIAALKDGFGFIETMAQDGEIFFHSSSLVGEFGALEVGQEVEYVVSNKASMTGKLAADMVKPVPKDMGRRPEVYSTIYHGTVSRPLRGANAQSEYPGLIESTEGLSFQFGITSMLNKKEIVQTGEAVEFHVDANNKAVNIRALRKKLRSTVEAVKGPYGFLSYELEDGKKLFFHMSEVKDHVHLNPGDEVEFVVLQNPRNRKSSACSVVKLGESQRPERLLNRLSKLSVDESAPRLIVIRQPYGPDGSRGFSQPRSRRTTAGTLG